MRISSLLLLVTLVAPAVAHAAELSGSRASMRRQHAIAVEEEYSFLRTPADVRHFAELGKLTRIESGPAYRLHQVSYPFARPEVERFLRTFGDEFLAATGDPLVVTSLTRPATRQPGNASPLSVHPAGMAVDLRIPKAADDRAWLEGHLLDLEREGVLDVTRERSPAHYHVAVFADPLARWIARRDSTRAAASAAAKVAAMQAVSRAASAKLAPPPPAPADWPRITTGILVLVGAALLGLRMARPAAPARAEASRQRS